MLGSRHGQSHRSCRAGVDPFRGASDDLPLVVETILTDWEEKSTPIRRRRRSADAGENGPKGLDYSLDLSYLIHYISAWLRFVKPGVSRSGSPIYAMRRPVLGLPLESGVWHWAIPGTFGRSVRE